jgi:hypothetical protein
MVFVSRMGLSFVCLLTVGVHSLALLRGLIDVPWQMWWIRFVGLVAWLDSALDSMVFRWLDGLGC